jgi:hypothetical protein
LALFVARAHQRRQQIGRPRVGLGQRGPARFDEARDGVVQIALRAREARARARPERQQLRGQREPAVQLQHRGARALGRGAFRRLTEQRPRHDAQGERVHLATDVGAAAAPEGCGGALGLFDHHRRVFLQARARERRLHQPPLAAPALAVAGE